MRKSIFLDLRIKKESLEIENKNETINKIIENENANTSNENLVNSEEVELSNLKPEELIISLDQLIDNHNPFSVSKRAENIKALFYKSFNNIEKNNEAERAIKNNLTYICNETLTERLDFSS